MDNGYMLFDHFRVPRSAMLSRYAEVSDETGAFVSTGHPAVVYGSLTFVRGQIIATARFGDSFEIATRKVRRMTK
jgi:acyl-CoA oxidase